MEMGNFSDSEVEDINNLPEEVFAELSFILSVANDEQPDYFVNGDLESVVPCLEAAIGLTVVKGIISGTGGLITATTALQVIKALGTRYLGYIGLVYTIYKFAECMDSASEDAEAVEEGDTEVVEEE